MKTEYKKSIAQDIERLVPKLIPLGEGVYLGRSEHTLFFNLAHYLDENSTRDYYSILRKFIQVEPYATLISVKLLADLFEKLLAQYMSKTHLIDEVCHLIDELETKALLQVKKWHYYVPVEGVQLKTPEMSFGPHRLFQMDIERREKLVDQFFSIIDQTLGDDEQKKFQRDLMRASFDKAQDLTNKACLQLEIEGDQSRVKEEAIKVASPIIHVLTFTGQGHLWSTQKCIIGLGAAFAEQMRHYPMISTDLTTAAFFSEWRSDDRQTLVIDDNALAGLKKQGLEELTDICTKRQSEMSEIEKMLRLAVQTFYNGYTALDRISEYINYIMILENLLSPSDKDQLVKTIAEGTAILLETTGEKRIALNDYVKKLYRKRSKLVHGKTDQVYLEEVRSAQVISFRLIRTVLENRSNWGKQDDILDHIEQIKFS